MRRLRSTVLTGTGLFVLLLAACSGAGTPDPTTTAASTDPSASVPAAPSATSSSGASEDPGRRPGDVSLPGAVDVQTLPATDAVSGVVLVQRDAAGGCVVVTYADGMLARRGTFPVFTAEHGPSATGCEAGRQYTADFSARVGEIYANYVDANTYDRHVVVQGIDQPEKDVTGKTELSSPAVGPDDKIYVMAGDPYNGTPSVMGMDGSNLTPVPHGTSRPAWLGGKLVKDNLKAVSNADGSLAVEYIKKGPGGGSVYRVGTVQEGKAYGPAIDGDVVIPTGGEALPPLSWVGENQFLTASQGVVYLNTITPASGADKPSISVAALVTLPEDYMSSANPVGRIVVCDTTAYWTVSLGGTQALPDRQFALLGVDVSDGTLTAHAALLSPNRDGENYPTEVMSCV